MVGLLSPLVGSIIPGLGGRMARRYLPPIKKLCRLLKPECCQALFDLPREYRRSSVRPVSIKHGVGKPPDRVPGQRPSSDAAGASKQGLGKREAARRFVPRAVRLCVISAILGIRCHISSASLKVGAREDG